MSVVLDEGLALFAGLNVIPKRSFLTEYSCRIDPGCYPKLMRRLVRRREASSVCHAVIPSTWTFTRSPFMAMMP